MKQQLILYRATNIRKYNSTFQIIRHFFLIIFQKKAILSLAFMNKLHIYLHCNTKNYGIFSQIPIKKHLKKFYS